MARKEIPRELSIYINDKQVVNSFNGINRAISQTRNELSNLNRNSATYNEDLTRLNNQLAELTPRQAEFRNEIRGTTESIDDSAGSFAKLRDGLLSGDLASAREGLAGIKTEMINLVKSSLAFIATPIGAAIAVLSGIALGTKAIFDFNQEAEKSAVLIENLSGKTGQVVEDIRVKMQSLTDTFGLTFDQLAGAVDNLVDTGVAKDELEALDKIKQGLLTAPDKNEFIATLESSALTAKQVGLSLEEVIALKQQIEAVGIDPEKTFGAFQKASAKLSAQADSLRIKLTEAFGASFTDEILAKVKTGQITTVQALDLIGKKSKEVGLDQTQQAQLSNELFGKAGLAAGGFATLTDAATQSLKKQNQELNGNQKALDELEKANFRLATAQSELFRVKDFGELWTKIKASATDALSSMLNWIIDVKKDIQPLIDFVGVAFANAWENLKGTVVIAFDIIGGVLKLFSNTISTTFNFIKKIMTLDFSGAFDVLINGFKSIGNIVENTFAKIKNTIIGTLQGIVSNISPILSALGLDVDKIQKKLESFKSKEVVLKTSNQNETSVTSGEKTITKETAEELAKQKALRDEARQKEADARKAAADKKRAEEEKAAKEELDRMLALAKAKADLAKAELSYFIANNRSKLDSTKALTPELIAEEANRLIEIQNRQLLALDQENENRVNEATAKAKSAEELTAIIETINLEYETKRIELTAQTDGQILANKNELAEQDKQLKAEQLVAENELALMEAGTKEQEDAIKRKQDYNKQIASYDDLLRRKVITKQQYDDFEAAAAAKKKELDRVAEIQKVQGTLGSLNQLAGAVTELFGQSKEMAIVQAGINGAMAVTSILAQYPKFDGGFAMAAAIAAAGISTVAQIAKITKSKPAKTPKFFYGGHTGTTPHYGYDEYGPMTGMVHDEEYVIPKAMTQSPRYANTIAWLEQERTGRKVNKFVDGGATSSNVVPDVVMNENTTRMESLLQAVLFRLENPVSPNLVIGYDHAKSIQDLNDERSASDQNSTVSE